MDNVDHEESTSSGIGGSHDTILVLFQKSNEIEINEEVSRKPEDIATLSPNKRSLSHVLDFQKFSSFSFQEPSFRIAQIFLLIFDLQKRQNSTK